MTWTRIGSILLGNNFKFTPKFSESIFRVKITTFRTIDYPKVLICCFDGENYWKFKNIYPKLNEWLLINDMSPIPAISPIRAIGFRTFYCDCTLVIDVWR